MLPSINEDGIQVPLSNMDYALHGLTFFWKLLCAFLPPRKYLGAYPTFFLSLVFIGVLTLLVEEFANQLGCVAGLKTAVTGITLVAIGTSLPDAFASRTAARLDESADNSIGNITGSNSVNVFLGLGLPWLIGAINAKLNGQVFCVATDGVFEATVLFLCTAILCLGLLILRRRLYSGELGGPCWSKWSTGLFIILLWFGYILVMSLRAYGHIKWDTILPPSHCLHQKSTVGMS
ncbi:hypothetical protein EG68_06323 [Paragonimus skrjabini miyazakii]|uniref:Sodium/calcium exchanger membrane region domain-containing protein n=1 Tax=Paragonimus skrjabini miyazakii TaxID=59628 RepID=A0A8S9YUT7_9TREM|nr:hypothetical protein EG68_06323 [Paragonimus skrjabini miyazakii]